MKKESSVKISIIRWACSIFFSITCFQAQAGLIIEIDKNIDASKIKNILIKGNQLTIQYNGGSRVINLPINTLDSVILWAKQGCVGPFVFSVDGALVPNAPDYIAPCLPPGLGSAMLEYDVYAHTLAQGAMPDDTLLHPLVKAQKNTLLMPHQQFKLLMNLQNKSASAQWFRHLASRYASYPGCIGEFTVQAIASKKGFPVSIKARSYRWIRPYLWYRESRASVPNEQDHLALSLPYNALDQHIESNFEDYRKVFEPLDELASIVEAYAILAKVAVSNPKIWNECILNKYRTFDNIQGIGEIYPSSQPDISTPSFYSRNNWKKLSIQWIGDKIETSTEADLALSLMWSNSYDMDDFDSDWPYEIKQIAQRDPDILCKLILYNCKSNKNLVVNQAGNFFKNAGRGIRHLRLRVMGYKYLKDFKRSAYLYSRDEKSDANEILDSILVIAKQNILTDFIAEVDRLKKLNKDNSNLLIWEDLSQSVYSVGLLDLFDDEYEEIDAEFAKRLAYVHYRRGLIDQKDLSLAYRHAHFRFLKYLNDLAEYDEDLEKDIYQYRKELASKMGLKGWDENEFEYDYYESNWDEDPEESISNTELYLAYPLLEGKLSATSSLFRATDSAIKEGTPLFLQSAAGKNTLLLMDSRIITQSFGKNISRWPKSFKVYGILQNNDGAITPQRIEYLIENKWLVLNLPHSGIAESGVLSGN